MIPLSVIIIHALPHFFTQLYAIFDAMMDARKDYPSQTMFWKHGELDFHQISTRIYDEAFRERVAQGKEYASVSGKKITKFDLKYIGGNKWYKPSYPWTADFWHASKAIMQFMIVPLVVSSILLGMTVWSHNLLDFTFTVGFFWWNLWYISYFLLHWEEGKAFTFYYHFLFKKGAKFTDWFKDFILGKKKYA